MKSTALLKGKVLISGMNFIWNSRKDKKQKFEERQQLPSPGAFQRELETEGDHKQEKK